MFQSFKRRFKEVTSSISGYNFRGDIVTKITMPNKELKSHFIASVIPKAIPFPEFPESGVVWFNAGLKP